VSSVCLHTLSDLVLVFSPRLVARAGSGEGVEIQRLYGTAFCVVCCGRVEWQWGCNVEHM